MTTFQDPPFQSRRSVRQSEREEVSLTESAGPEAPLNLPTAPLGSGRRARTGEVSGLIDVPVSSPIEPQSAVQPPPLVEPRRGDSRPEPLDYSTRGGPQIPTYDGPSFSNNPNPSSGQSEEQFRVRDFSPEGRRASQRNAETPQAWSPPEGAAAQLPAALDYHTQAGAPAAASFQTSSSAPAPAPAPDARREPVPQAATADHAARFDESSLIEQTLTRRELRALRAHEEADIVTSGQVPLAEGAPVVWPVDAAAPAAAAPVVPQPVVPQLVVPQLVEPTAAPTTASALANAMAEFEALTRSAQQKAAPATFAAPAPITAPAAPPAPAPEPTAFDFLLKSTEPAAESQRPATFPPAAVQAPMQQPPAAQVPTQQPSSQPPPAAAPVLPPAFAAPMPAPAPVADGLTPQFVPPELTTTGQSYATSTGHWSNQAELDDESQDFENTLSRDLGRANPTTNALVLPITSQHTDFAASLNATGEILATGSINLPDGFGSRGGDSRRYDDPEVDHLFDAFDNEIISIDSAPVRAIRSVSTQTATRGVIHSNTSNGNRMLTVLLVAGCVMAIAVGGLLVAGIVFNIF